MSHCSASRILPTNRAFLSILFASFPKASLPPPQLPKISLSLFNTAPRNLKALLITLHALFPNELLPALDLLDRGLVRKLVLPANDSRPNGPESALQQSLDRDASSAAEEGSDTRVDNRWKLSDKSRTAHYVRSSHQHHARSRFASASTRIYDAFLAPSRQSYEVRLKVWNCSCPAFTFASVGCSMDEYDERQGIAEGNVMEGLGENPQSSDNGQAREDQEFGGLMTGQREMPVCKHLLACFLAESWTEFAGYVEEGLVGREEMGSWAAGWGG